MSKFDELCQAYKESRGNYFAYRDESFEFARKLIGGYIKFLEIPKEQFSYFPLDKELKQNTKYSLFGALHLDNDSYWHLGLQITLYSAPNEYPHQPLLLKFMFKKESEGKFLVKISDVDEGHKVRVSEDSDFLTFYEFLQKQIESHFKNELQEFLEQSAPLQTIGFIPD